MAPWAPVAPDLPLGPWKPSGPGVPSEPRLPAGPLSPVAPLSPLAPVAPLAPALPAGPRSPVGPLSPVSPCRRGVGSASLAAQQSASPLRTAMMRLPWHQCPQTPSAPCRPWRQLGRPRPALPGGPARQWLRHRRPRPARPGAPARRWLLWRWWCRLRQQALPCLGALEGRRNPRVPWRRERTQRLAGRGRLQLQWRLQLRGRRRLPSRRWRQPHRVERCRARLQGLGAPSRRTSLQGGQGEAISLVETQGELQAPRAGSERMHMRSASQLPLTAHAGSSGGSGGARGAWRAAAKQGAGGGGKGMHQKMQRQASCWRMCQPAQLCRAAAEAGTGGAHR